MTLFEGDTAIFKVCDAPGTNSKAVLGNVTALLPLANPVNNTF